MSYVRLSTPLALPEGVSAIDFFVRSDLYWDVPTSDFYIYDSVGDFVSVNVAGNRHRPTGPFTGQKVIDVDPKTKLGKGNPDWFAWLDANRETIDHPAAGQTFEFPDMSDAIAKVEELIAEGFLAPDWLLDDMRASLDAGDG